MARFLALLRAVNVGGTGKLPMAELRALVERLGFTDVRTFIASGNVVFDGKGTSAAIEKKLEAALLAERKMSTDVMVRTPAEWQALLAANPFREQAARTPEKVVVVVLKRAPAAAQVAETLAKNKGKEELRVVGREAFVFYPDGIGRSKLSLKPLGCGTARNFGSVQKLAEMLTA